MTEKTTSEIMEIFESDQEIKDLILNSEHVKANYVPRKSKWRQNVTTRAGITAKWFLHRDNINAEGSQLYYLLESRYKMRMTNRERGNIRRALILFLTDSFNKN